MDVKSTQRDIDESLQNQFKVDAFSSDDVDFERKNLKTEILRLVNKKLHQKSSKLFHNFFFVVSLRNGQSLKSCGKVKKVTMRRP